MLKKILFTCSLIGFAIGCSNLGQASQWGVGIPLGAVLLFLSLIVTLLEKEAALYDAEQQQTSAHLADTTSAPATKGQRLQIV